jgi:probable HAF family extracellular repeat protein
MSTGCTAPRRKGHVLSLSVCAAVAALTLTSYVAQAAPAIAARRPAAKYQVAKILHPEGQALFPLAFNNAGAVVGAVQSETGERAFHYSGTTLTILPTLGGANARAWDINSSGIVVGEAQTAEGATHAFIWNSNTEQMTDLGGLLGAVEGSIAYGINDAGQVVGEMGPAYFGNAFVWSEADGVTDLGPGYAKSINASGGIAGQVRQTTEEGFTHHPAVWQDGAPTLIPTFGGDHINHYATDLNDHGTVVGASMGEDLEMHGFVWKNGVLTDVGDFGGSGHSAAFSVNNQNQVVGSANYRPFLWENGRLTDLSTQVPQNTGVFLSDAVGITPGGRILCHAYSLSNIWVGAVLSLNGGAPPPAGDVDLSGDWTAATKRVKGVGRKLTATVSSTFTVRNNGGGASKKFAVKYYLSTTPDLSGVLAPLGSTKINSLRANASKLLRYKVTLKREIAEAAAGKYVVAVIDEAGAILETDETNNLRAVQIP